MQRVSRDLDDVLRSDAGRLLRIMTGLQGDAAVETTAAAINDLLNWLLVGAQQAPLLQPIEFRLIGSEAMPAQVKDVKFVASTNGRRIRIHRWARLPAFERTEGRTPVDGVHHHALVLLHEVGHTLHHTGARHRYFREVWAAIVRRRATIPSPTDLQRLAEFFADCIARQVAATAVELGYRDRRRLL